MAEVKITILADDKSATALNSVSKNMEGVKSALSATASAAKSFVAGLVGFSVLQQTAYKLKDAFSSVVPAAVNLASETNRLQRITGLTAESASELIAVADQVGVGFGTLENAVAQVTRKMGGLKDIESIVMDASGNMVDVFEKFRIEVKNTDGTIKSFSEVLEQIRSKIQSASSETEKMAIATQFFRGTAAELMPLLNMSAETWKEMAEDAKKYGIILSQGNVDAARKYIYAHRDLDDALQGLKITIGQEFIPALTETTKKLTETTRAAMEFAKANKEILSLPWDTLKIIGENFKVILLSVTAAAAVRFAPAIAEWIAGLKILQGELILTEALLRSTGAGLAFMVGWKIGEAINEWADGTKHLTAAQKWLAENQDYVNIKTKEHKKILDEQKKAEEEAKARAEAQAKAIKEIGKAMAEWDWKIKELNPDIDEMSQKINALWKETAQYLDKVNKAKDLSEDMKTAFRMDILKGFETGAFYLKQGQYREELKTTFDLAKQYALDALEAEKESVSARIDSLLEYRAALTATYDAAISQAQRYYAVSAAIDGMIRKGRAFLEGYKAKPLGWEEQMEKEKKGINELLKQESFNIFDPEKTQETMTAIENFLTKYKGAKDDLGFDISFEGMTHEYEGLLNKLDMMKQNTDAAGNAWLDFADKQVYAIETVDEWIRYLQNRITEVDVQISYVREIKVETSAAIANVKLLVDWINHLNYLTSQYKANMVAVQTPEEPIEGSYQAGTSYVPKTGVYLLHQGETVLTKKEAANSDNRRYSNSITFSPTIHIHGVDDPRLLAKKIAKPLRDEFRRLYEVQ